MILLGGRFEQRPLIPIKRASSRLMPASVIGWKPGEGRISVVGEPGHARSQQVMLKVRFCWPNIGGHAFSSFGEALVTFAREADMTPHGEPACGGLEIFNGARQHRTSLISMALYQPSKRRRDVLREGLNSLCVPRTVGWSVGDQCSPGTLSSAERCGLRHAFVERIEYGVLFGDAPLVKGCFGHLHRPSNVAIVLVPPPISSSCGGLGMRSLDFDASHFPLLNPLPLDGGVVEEGVKTQKTKVDQGILVPFFNPQRPIVKMDCWDGNISVMVDDQSVIGRDSDIKFNPVEQLNGMLKAFEGVFGGLFPSRLPLHSSAFSGLFLKVCPSSKPCENCSQHVVRPECIKRRFIASVPWTPMRS